jgi:hypothetical protein
MPALFGLMVLLFLPSLFAWSVSVLKEPLTILLSAVSLSLAVGFSRSTRWRSRLLIVAAILALASSLQLIRQHGALFLGLAAVGGLALGFLARRPALIVAALVVVPILTGAVLRSPRVQIETYSVLQAAARQHWGAVVVSSGHGYPLLDDRFYADLNAISSLELAEAARFLVRAVVAYVTMPRPWDVESRAEAAYIPELVIWYVLVALAAGGVLFGFRRDPATTGLLLAHGVLLAAGTAFVEGNIGTLVRHRSLAVPFIVWLSGVGACELLGARPASLGRAPGA